MSDCDALEGLKVLDLGVGMAPALVSQILAGAGAEVLRIVPKDGDPFEKIYPAYHIWRRKAAFEAAPSAERLQALLSEADICILGGEDFPGMEPSLDPKTLEASFPRLVILDIGAYPEELGGEAPRAVECLVQARSGLVFEQYSDRPILMSFSPANIGAALLGLVSTLAALYERETSGRGQIARTSLAEGVLAYGGPLWKTATTPTPAFTSMVPKDPARLILKCSDGKHVHIVLGSAGSKARMYRAFGLDDSHIDPSDNGLPRPGASAREFFGVDVELFKEPASRIRSTELLATLWDGGIAAEAVMEPGECWSDPQIVQNGTIERDEKGQRYLGMPMSFAWSPASSKKQHRKTGDGPLAGVRILDLGAFVAGPSASMILGDLGADVVKVEGPNGDPNRSSYGSFASANRNKRSISVDLKNKSGLDIIRRLCAQVDVVTSNFRTGVSSRLGVDPKYLHSIAPDLIVMEAPAFGLTGPKATNAGFDAIIQAFCGLELQASGVGNDPVWNRTIPVDYGGGMLGAVAILLALYKRLMTGHGAEVCLPLVNAGLYLTSDLVQAADGTFRTPPSLNRFQTGRHPAECLYPSKDGWIAVAARDDRAGNALAKALALSGFPANLAEWGEREHDAIWSATIQRTSADLVTALRRHDVWTEECRLDAVLGWLGEPKLLERKTAWQFVHPEFGCTRHIGPLMSFSRSRLGTVRPPPTLGEHSREILRQYGYDETAIKELAAASVIRATVSPLRSS